VHLQSARLYWARLPDANLNHANLSGAHITVCPSDRASLIGADLSISYLNVVNLVDADLTGANLTGACLSKVNFSGAAFDGAIFNGTLLGVVDLSAANGLSSVKHIVPSVVSIDAFYKSNGRIPRGLLRDAGLQEVAIDYLLSMTRTPFQFYSCFISHSSADHTFATRIYSDLQNAGVRAWFAPEDLKIGDRFRSRIDEEIRIFDKMLLVLSEHSVNSAWVETEVESAFEREARSKQCCLFPITLDDFVLNTGEAWAANIRRTRLIGDFRNWNDGNAYRRALERLLRDLRKTEESIS